VKWTFEGGIVVWQKKEKDATGHVEWGTSDGECFVRKETSLGAFKERASSEASRSKLPEKAYKVCGPLGAQKVEKHLKEDAMGAAVAGEKQVEAVLKKRAVQGVP